MADQSITVRFALPEGMSRADAMNRFSMGTVVNGAQVTGIYQGDHFKAYDQLKERADHAGVHATTVAD